MLVQKNLLFQVQKKMKTIKPKFSSKKSFLSNLVNKLVNLLIFCKDSTVNQLKLFEQKGSDLIMAQTSEHDYIIRLNQLVDMLFVLWYFGLITCQAQSTKFPRKRYEYCRFSPRRVIVVLQLYIHQRLDYVIIGPSVQ